MSEHTLMQNLDMMILNQLWITGNSQASLLVVNSSYKAFYLKLSVWEKDFSDFTTGGCKSQRHYIPTRF